VLISVEPHELFERDGADLHMRLPVSVFQAMLGASVRVPTILGEDKTVSVPAGAQPGQVVRIRGAGMPRLDGRGRGDLLVHLEVVVPSRLSKEQRRLIAEAAALAGERPGEDEGLLERLRRRIASEG